MIYLLHVDDKNNDDVYKQDKPSTWLDAYWKGFAIHIVGNIITDK